MAEISMKPIYDATRKKQVASGQIICRSALSKAKGLMFSSKGYLSGRGMVFLFNKPARRSIHMFGVFYPIDLLFLGTDGRVVEICECLKPFRIYNPKKGSCSVVELESGAVHKAGVRVGDEIQWG